MNCAEHLDRSEMDFPAPVCLPPTSSRLLRHRPEGVLVIGGADRRLHDLIAGPDARERSIHHPQFHKSSPPKRRSSSNLLPKNLLLDQKDFWTAPVHFSEKQWDWALPSILVGGLLIKADQNIEGHVPTNKSTVSHSVTASNAGVAALVAGGGGLFLLGHLQHDDQKRETGILAGEAAIGAFADNELFKYAAGRERPFTGSGTGRFFVGGDSFPSTHAAVSWAIASVIAHEYTGPLTQLLPTAWPAASVPHAGLGKNISRPTSLSAALWVGTWDTRSSVPTPITATRRWQNMASFISPWKMKNSNPCAKRGTWVRAYVPLDSWVYPAVERLSALGYVTTQSFSLRPWTRLECARLVAEAAKNSADTDAPAEVEQLYRALAHEFGFESELMNGERNLSAQLESVYSRFLEISGTPLTDNYHFGQTLLNDYGRPYQHGFNAIDGASGWATAGPLVLYLRGEYQYAPSGPAPTQVMLNFFNGTDAWPTGPALPMDQSAASASWTRI